MKYQNITEATFLSRPNRFVAEVKLDNKKEIVHVKNTGRCELLVPGAKVWLTEPNTPNRKTKYDLIAVETDIGTINLDSQAPNKVVKEWLAKQQGYIPILAFVIQMPNIEEVLPNEQTDKQFAQAFHQAKQQGVRILNLTCDIKPDELTITAESQF